MLNLTAADEFVMLNLDIPARAPESPRVPMSNDVAQFIQDNWSDNAAVVSSFGGRQAFESTLDKIDELEAIFPFAGGAYFHLGDTPAETAENFANTQLAYKLTGIRPSLPGQMEYYLDQIAVSRKDPFYRAAILVAARAEAEQAGSPEYHNASHTSDVIAATIEFLKKNNALATQRVPGAVKLTRQEMILGVIAAAAHDIGHPGGKNALPGEKTAADPLRLEKQSAAIVEPLLDAVRLPFDSIQRIRTAILATSLELNGPVNLIKEIDALHRSGQPIEWEKLPGHEKFPELRLLAEDPALRVIAQNLRSADLGESCLFGPKANAIATRDLEMEWRKRGYDDVLIGDMIAEDGLMIENGTTVKARKAFLDFVAFGEAGPVAAGARAAAGANYAQLYAGTETECERARILAKTHAVLSICFDPVVCRFS